MPRPFLGCQIKAEIKGFLLMYHLFLYYQWFSQNIEKGWRKIFEKRLFPRYLKMTKIIKNISSSGFPFSERTITSTETNDTSAKSPWFQLSFGTLKVGVALSGGRHALSPWKVYFVEFYGRGMGFWLLAFYEMSRTKCRSIRGNFWQKCFCGYQLWLSRDGFSQVKGSIKSGRFVENLATVA